MNFSEYLLYTICIHMAHSCLLGCLLWTDGDSSLHSNRLSCPYLTGADLLGEQWLVKMSFKQGGLMGCLGSLIE